MRQRGGSTFPSELRRHGSSLALFATHDLDAGTPVDRFAGAIVPWRDVPADDEPRAVPVGPGRRMLVETPGRGLVHYAPRTTRPSCAVEAELVVVTTRRVRQGERLTCVHDALAAAVSLGEPCAPLVAPAVTIGSAGVKGRGVFAARAFSRGELIERAPAIVVLRPQADLLERTTLDDYVFCWGREEDNAVALGYGSLYNHSYRPSAVFLRRPGDSALDFVALRDMAPGDEIAINYNGDPADRSPVWFEILEHSAVAARGRLSIQGAAWRDADPKRTLPY